MKRLNTNCGFGDSIDDYEVLGVLGRGGFATVYKARSKHTQRCVAIKTIDKALIQRVGLTNRVRQEVEIHSRLKHPFVVELYTFFQDNNFVYLVMEWAENGELQRYIKEKMCRSMQEYEAACVLRQVVSGMLYLHSHRIMHRDISLSNLLLSKDMNVKIADFGLAAQIKRENEKHVTMCGTPNFISPEVVSRSPHGLAADVWALGCLLYTLLIGKPPFDANAVQTTLTKVVSSDYELPQQLSPEASDLISRLLKKNPEERIELGQILQHPFLKRYESYDNWGLYEDTKPSAAAGTAAYDIERNSNRDAGVTANQCSRNMSQGNFSLKNNKSCDSGILTFSDSSTSSKSYGNCDSYGVQSMTPSHASSTSERFYDRPSSSANLPHIHEHQILTDIQPSFKAQNDENRIPYHQSLEGLNRKFGYLRCEDAKENINSNSIQQQIDPLTCSMPSPYKFSQALDHCSTAPRNKQLRPLAQSNQFADNNKNTEFYRSTPLLPVKSRDPIFPVLSSKSSENMANIVIPGIPAGTQKSVQNDNFSLNERMQPCQDAQRLSTSPLNTARLQPTRFRTKSAIMSILRNGVVALEFTKFRSKLNEDRITDICWISGDGQKVIIYEPSPGRGLPISNDPPELPVSFEDGCKQDQAASSMLRVFTYENLPNKHWRKYLMASRFVNLVKSSTPKITYYSAQAKFHLMESMEHFEALFYNGSKITHSSGDGGLKVYNQHGRLLPSEEHAAEEARALIEHKNECLKYCLALCETMDSFQRQHQSNASFCCFPLVIGRRPTIEREGRKLQEQKDFFTRPPSSATASTLSTDYSAEGTDAVYSPMPAVSMTSSLSHEKPDEHVMGCDKYATVSRHAILPDIGRAVQMSDGSVEVQFHDGSRIAKYQRNICGNRSDGIAYTPAGGNTMYFAPQDELPLIVRNKLAHLEYVESDFRNAFKSDDKVFNKNEKYFSARAIAEKPFALPLTSIRNVTNQNTNIRYVR